MNVHLSCLCKGTIILKFFEREILKEAKITSKCVLKGNHVYCYKYMNKDNQNCA